MIRVTTRTTLLSATTALALLVGPTLAVAANPSANDTTTSTHATGTLSRADQAFINKATQSGEDEIEAGKLAMSKASNPAVKMFGRWMVSSHTEANRMLESFTSQHGSAKVTTQPTAAQGEQLAKLQRESGAAFDRAYIEDEITDHQQAIEDFQKEANSGENKAVKTFASNMLPMLQDHLAGARELREITKNEKGASADTPNTTTEPTTPTTRRGG